MCSNGRCAVGCIPASPRVPEPRSKLIKIVSAWSSAVCPVITPCGSTPYRASRARASVFAPCSTATDRDSNCAPSGVASCATNSASVCECSRNPWSTCHAVTFKFAAHASTSKATESAPPETAQSTLVPEVGKVHRESKSVTTGNPRAESASEGISPAELLQRFALFAVWILCHGHFGHVSNDQVDNGKSANDQQHKTQPEMPYNCDHVNNRSQRVSRCQSHWSGIFAVFRRLLLK